MANTRLTLVLLMGSVSMAVTSSGCRHPHVWQPVPHAPSIQHPKDDFTLVWDKEDANGEPLDPYWGLEKAQSELPPREQGQPPYACEPDPYSNACTENKGLVMDPPQFPNSVICKVGNLGAKFNGHADWIVATQHGCADWEDQSADGDYNFRLFPPDRYKSILTKNNAQFVGLEFDYYETIVNSHLKLWTDLRSEVQKENDDQHSHQSEISKLLNPSNPNVNPRVAVVGLFGLDCEHGCKSEIHPVLALAIEINPDPNDNTWVMFVRNWGDEGFCSRYRHLVEFQNNTVNVLLLDGTDSEGPVVIPEKTHMFVSNGAKIDFPVISYWQSHGPVVSFSLPDPVQTQAYVELEIHFRWNKLHAPSCTTSPPVLGRKAVGENAEDYLQEVQKKLTQQKSPAAPLVEEAASRPVSSVVEVTIPQKIDVQTFVPTSKSPALSAPARLSADRNQATRNIRDIQALCRAYNNRLPLYQGRDISPELCNERRLTKQLESNKQQ
jgi:hypothetical protein